MNKKWFYDYANKCDCSEDDKCGCSYPENMARNVDYVIGVNKAEKLRRSQLFVGQKALNFTAPALLADNTVQNEFNFFDYIAGNYALLFFYPADFSSVCMTELNLFNNAYEKFSQRNVKLVGVSVDSVLSHQAWKKMPFNEGGIGEVKILLVSDILKTISFDYGVLGENGSALRASFLLDKNCTIRYQSVQDSKINRDVGEMLRVIDALYNVDNNSDVCLRDFHWKSDLDRATEMSGQNAFE